MAREQAAEAALLARAAAEKAAPRVGAAVEWASPRIEKGLLAAGPAAEAAAERVAPAVDAARDRIVQELLPKIVEAVTVAATAGAAAQRTAAERVSASLENASAALAATPPPQPSHRGRRVLVFGTLAAAGAAGLAAWRRSRSSAPEWDALTANEPAFTGGPEPTPSTLADPAPSASATTSVTEQPSPDGAPETSVGDPVLDGLGTSEATPAEAADTASPAGEPVELDQTVEVVECVDEEPVDDDTLGDASTDDESPKTGRRRRTS